MQSHKTGTKTIRRANTISDGLIIGALVNQLFKPSEKRMALVKRPTKKTNIAKPLVSNSSVLPGLRLSIIMCAPNTVILPRTVAKAMARAKAKLCRPASVGVSVHNVDMAPRKARAKPDEPIVARTGMLVFFSMV